MAWMRRRNALPFDSNPPSIASGIRIGTPATTTRGFGADEMREVRDVCGRFPVPGLSEA